jgi:phosphoserine phosphatase
MFELTGHPTAVNPTRELLANIRADAELMKRIRVIVERKDVIYHIDPNTVTL